MKVEVQEFGKTQSGETASLFVLRNANGHTVKMTNYGAIIVSVEVADRNGSLANVNLGYPNLDGYLERHPYFGSTVGRFCNRIAKGRFTLDGTEYSLAVNNGPNHLHGGIVGFDRFIWDAKVLDQGVLFSLVSPDGQEGYPGNLAVEAEYTWNDNDELSYTFRATTDAPTVLNLTNHAYWNLAGESSGDVLGQEVQLNCDMYLDVDDSLIPTGKLIPVEGSVLDFKQYQPLGRRIKELPATKGYDHCFVVNGKPGELRTCGIARDPVSGRAMEVKTTQPGMQLYTGNHLEGDYPPHGGFCMETQHYPDSPNRLEFPTTRLDPGQAFSEQTVHRFFVD